MCTQPGDLGLAGSEDCLYLDVYMPANHTATSDPLPAKIWVYGGGWVHGECVLNKQK